MFRLYDALTDPRETTMVTFVSAWIFLGWWHEDDRGGGGAGDNGFPEHRYPPLACPRGCLDFI